MKKRAGRTKDASSVREFLLRVGGFEKVRRYTHQGETKLTEVVVRRMQANEPVFAEDARFLVEHTGHVTKFALPSPFLIASWPSTRTASRGSPCPAREAAKPAGEQRQVTTQ